MISICFYQKHDLQKVPGTFPYVLATDSLKELCKWSNSANKICPAMCIQWENVHTHLLKWQLNWVCCHTGRLIAIGKYWWDSWM